jgi:hypothetical protein
MAQLDHRSAAPSLKRLTNLAKARKVLVSEVL